mgnify:CR=1 FL=1
MGRNSAGETARMGSGEEWMMDITQALGGLGGSVKGQMMGRVQTLKGGLGGSVKGQMMGRVQTLKGLGGRGVLGCAAHCACLRL